MKVLELPKDNRQLPEQEALLRFTAKFFSTRLPHRNHLGRGLSNAQNSPLVVCAAFQRNSFEDVSYTGRIWHRENLLEECIIKDL